MAAARVSKKTWLPASGQMTFVMLESVGSVSWAASAGSITSGGVFTAPAAPGTVVTITATDSVAPVTYPVEVVKTFPLTASYGSSASLKKGVLMSFAEDGSASARKKSERLRSYELKFDQYDESELAALENFWDEHHPGKIFYYADDSRTNVSGPFIFDSDVKWEPVTTCIYSFNVIIREVP